MLIGREAGALISTRSVPGTLVVVEGTEGVTLGGGLIRGSPFGPGRISCTGTSMLTRSEAARSWILSAFGPVGGTTDPEGTLFLGATGGGGAVATGAAKAGPTVAKGAAGGCAIGGGAGAAGVGTLDGSTLGGGATAALGFTSEVGFLQTLDPKAGTAAGGDEARGAYLSLDASARLANRRSSLPGSRRESLTTDGSIAIDERRE